MNKTREALRLLDETPGLSQVAAAKAVNMHIRVLTKAIAERKKTVHMRCPTCDHVLPYLKDVFRKE